MSTFLILLLKLIIFPFNNGQENCVYGGLDLSPLTGVLIQCIQEDDPTAEMMFAPCDSTLECSFWDLTRWMITQVTMSGNCRAGIAKFDNDVKPSQTTVDGKRAWLFQYANGETTFCQSERTLDLTFVCDEDADPWDQQSSSCGEYLDVECAYYLTIYTKHACSSGSDDDSSGLSTGTISLIILLVVIVVYCVGGYVFNAMRNPDQEGKWTDFSYNIPNASFWSILPSLVFAGCAETTSFIKSKMNKEGGGKGRTDTYSELDGDVTSQTEYQ